MSELSNYNFVVKYRPGKVHTDVDVLSRLILDESKIYQKYSETTSPAEFNMLYKSLKQNWISSITVDPVGYEKKLGDCLNFDNLQQSSSPSQKLLLHSLMILPYVQWYGGNKGGINLQDLKEKVNTMTQHAYFLNGISSNS